MFDPTLLAIANAVRDANLAGTDATREMVKAHYATDAVSVEALAMSAPDGNGSREAVGIDAIFGKHDWFDGAFEVHSSECHGPFLHGDDRFALIYELDATGKADGERTQMKEVAIYTVADGKVVREEFYYTA